MRILIVDEIKENLYLLETLLKGNGYEGVTAKKPYKIELSVGLSCCDPLFFIKEDFINEKKGN